VNTASICPDDWQSWMPREQSYASEKLNHIFKFAVHLVK